jgi:hypothetical protein
MKPNVTMTENKDVAISSTNCSIFESGVVGLCNVWYALEISNENKFGSKQI